MLPEGCDFVSLDLADEQTADLSLLPVPDELADDEEGDPRAELVRRLLEYQKYRGAAEYLGRLDRLGRDVFERPPEPVPIIRTDAPLREMSVFSLVETFSGVLRKRKK